MEPVALRIQSAPVVDPMGAAQKGIQLGQMGLQVQKMQQDLIQQKLIEQRTRQAIETEAIGQQEAQRALDMRRYEDTARKTLADIMKRNTKPDASGKNSTDLRAALAEARMSGIDPTYTTELEGKLFQNEAGGLRNQTDRVNYIKKTLDDMASEMRYMTEAQAVRHLEQRAPLLARATGLPSEEIGRTVAEHFNLGQPGSSIVKTAQMFADAQIPVAAEREMAGRGIGREDFDPKSPTSMAARNFLRSQGKDVPNNISLVELRKIPDYQTLIEANKERIFADIVPREVKAGGLTEASEAQVALGVYNNARSAAAQLKKEYSTRLGSMTQSAIATLVKQDARYAAINDAINDYNQRNKTDISIAKDGLEPVLERLLRQQDTLVTQQRVGAKKTQAGSFAETGAEKMPTTPAKAPAGTVMMVHPRHKGGAVAIPVGEVEEAKAAGWRPQ